jgi:hypothetical protein
LHCQEQAVRTTQRIPLELLLEQPCRFVRRLAQVAQAALHSLQAVVEAAAAAQRSIPTQPLLEWRLSGLLAQAALVAQEAAVVALFGQVDTQAAQAHSLLAMVVAPRSILAAVVAAVVGLRLGSLPTVQP